MANTRFVTRSIGSVFLILMLFASQTPAEEGAQANVPSNWTREKDAIDGLWKEPSPVTAAEFYFSIPSTGIENEKTKILDYIFGSDPKRMFISRPYGSIAMEMLSGDIYAARSAIRLLGFVYSRWQSPPSYPADEAELIMISLGMLVRVNPALFLKACLAEQEDPYLKEKGFPVGFVPDTMNEIKTRASYELEMRKESLRSVKAPESRLVRDECLKALDKEIKKYGSDGPGSGKQEGRSLDDPKAKINYVFAEMQKRPSPENMKRVLALFSEVPRENLIDIILTLSPPADAQRAVGTKSL